MEVLKELTKKFPFLGKGVRVAIVRESRLSSLDIGDVYIIGIPAGDRILAMVAFDRDGKIKIPPVALDPTTNEYHYFTKSLLERGETAVTPVPSGYAPVLTGDQSRFTGALPALVWYSSRSAPLPTGVVVASKTAEGRWIVLDMRTMSEPTTMSAEGLGSLLSKYAMHSDTQSFVGEKTIVLTGAPVPFMEKVAQDDRPKAPQITIVKASDVEGIETTPPVEGSVGYVPVVLGPWSSAERKRKAVPVLLFPEPLDRRNLRPVKDHMLVVGNNTSVLTDTVLVAPWSEVSMEATPPTTIEATEVEPNKYYVFYSSDWAVGPYFVKDVYVTDNEVVLRVALNSSSNETFVVRIAPMAYGVPIKSSKGEILIPIDAGAIETGPLGTSGKATKETVKQAENRLVIHSNDRAATLEIINKDEGFHRVYNVPPDWVPLILKAFGFSEEEIRTAMLHASGRGVILPVGRDHMSAITFLTEDPEKIENKLKDIIKFIVPDEAVKAVSDIEKIAQELRQLIPRNPEGKDVLDRIVEMLGEFRPENINELLEGIDIGELKSDVARALIDAYANDMDRAADILERLLRALEDVETILGPRAT